MKMKGKIVSLLIAILLVIPFIKGQNVQYESQNSEPSFRGDIENSTPLNSTNTSGNVSTSCNSYPKAPGDIIFETWGIIPTLAGLVDHTALYIGNKKIVEADPHLENWNITENIAYKLMSYIYFINNKILPPALQEFVYRIHNESYKGNTKYGKVEEDGFGDVFNATFHCYGEVWIKGKPAYNTIRDRAVEWAQNRSIAQWPLVNDGFVTSGSRPFDYVSPWIVDKKQCDEFTVEEVMSNLSLAKTLDYGYGCSEFVWAAWYHATNRDVNLDSDPSTGFVWPWGIYNSTYVKIYYNSTDKSSSTNLNPDLSKPFEPVNIKIIYSSQTVYAYNVTSIEKVNEGYYFKTSNNETYPIDGLIDLELQQNL